MSWRLKALGLAFVCFAAGLVNAIFAAENLLHTIRGFMQSRPLLSSDSFAATGLLLTPMAAGIGLMFVFAKPATPEQMKNVSKRSMTWTGRFLIFILVSLVAALVAPIPQYWIVNYMALQRGYIQCPKPTWPRHQNDRWALPGPHGPTEHCPGEGTDPNL